MYFGCLHERHAVLTGYDSMGSVNLVVIVESMRAIIDHGSGELNEFHLPSLIAVGAALGMHFTAFLWLDSDFCIHLHVVIVMQASNLCFSCTASACAQAQVRYMCSGKITEMTYSSTASVCIAFTWRSIALNSHSLPGLLMSAGGSKWRWCMNRRFPAHITSDLFNYLP